MNKLQAMCFAVLWKSQKPIFFEVSKDICLMCTGQITGEEEVIIRIFIDWKI